MKPVPMMRSLLRGLALFFPLVVGLRLAATPAGAADSSLAVVAGDPWDASDLIAPAQLAKILDGAAGEKPTVFCVGVSSLYHNGHIVGAKYAGPGSSPKGIASLKNAVRDLARDAPLVIYCGCCPWTDCPNIRPAYGYLHTAGFKHVRVLTLPSNFRRDWVDHDFPVAKAKT